MPDVFEVQVVDLQFKMNQFKQ